MRPQAGLRGGLDQRSLDRLRATFGTEAGFHGILQDFLRSSAQLSRELEEALAAGRARETGRAAHTLKSMARLLGANDLAEACRQVEFLSHGSAPRIPVALVADLQGHLRAARAAVERILA